MKDSSFTKQNEAKLLLAKAGLRQMLQVLDTNSILTIPACGILMSFHWQGSGSQWFTCSCGSNVERLHFIYPGRSGVEVCMWSQLLAPGPHRLRQQRWSRKCKPTIARILGKTKRQGHKTAKFRITEERSGDSVLGLESQSVCAGIITGYRLCTL